ncbi:MAG: NTP transferase domain-containing protein [Bacteroidales bacterium]|nr:NTP transferase domain-containing protein [Bacteroidales bacterium]
MTNDNYLIPETATIKEAYVRLNKLPGYRLNLFVTDNNRRLIGSITDGDLRRAIVAGCTLDSKICDIMKKEFIFLFESEINALSFKEMKESSNITLLPILDHNHHLVELIDLRAYKSMLPIDAVLMAGGKGERLRPLTDNTPKPLLKVGDKAIIDHNIDRLLSYGIKHISVTVNYLKELLEEHFSEPKNGVKVNTVREPRYLGTIGSVKFVETFHNDTILVMNSDLFTNVNYEDFYLDFLKSEADMSVAAIPYSVSIPYGILEIEEDLITALAEKPTYDYYANAGLYLIKKEMLSLIPDNEFFNATDLIELLISRGLKVIRFPITGYWIDIGKNEDYKKANELVRHITEK